MEAMRSRNIPLIRQLAIELEEAKKKKQLQSDESSIKIPDYLDVCKSENGTLRKLPTVNGDQNLLDVIKDKKQLIVHDNVCYDIVSLINLIKADISLGNVWGLNPYLKQEGLVFPFEKDFKEKLLHMAKKNSLVPSTLEWENRHPQYADDLDLRGSCFMSYKKTPFNWLKKGWASDGSAFPTTSLVALRFQFNTNFPQQPGRTIILPDTAEVDDFIHLQLLPVYLEGALWSKKISATTGKMVLSPNVHFVFEDNQPERWYTDKLVNLKMEMAKFSPGFLSSRIVFRGPAIIISMITRSTIGRPPNIALHQKYMSIDNKNHQKNGILRNYYVGAVNSNALNNSIIEYIVTGIPMESTLLQRAIKIIQGFVKIKVDEDDFIVYHGAKTKIHNPSTKLISCTTFLSTTVDVETALLYGNILYKIKIPKYFPFFNFFDSLYQILLPIGTEMKIVKKTENKGKTLIEYECEINNSKEIMNTLNVFAKTLNSSCVVDYKIPRKPSAPLPINRLLSYLVTDHFVSEQKEIIVTSLIYRAKIPSIFLSVYTKPKFYNVKYLDIEYFMRPVQINDVYEGYMMTPVYLLSRAVNEILCNIIYKFYNIPVIESNIMLRSKSKIDHLNIMMMTEQNYSHFSSIPEHKNYIQELLVDCISANLDIFSLTHIALKDKKSKIRLHMGRSLAFSRSEFRQLNVSFFMNENATVELLDHIRSSMVLKKHYRDLMTDTCKKTDKVKTFFKILEEVDISQLEKYEPIEILKKDMDSINMGLILNPFIDDIIRMVKKRHQYLMKNKESTVNALCDPRIWEVSGGADVKQVENDVINQDKDVNPVAIVSSDFLTKMLERRMNTTCKKSKS